MTAKLTLSIDEKTIERAKRISTQHGKSISKMVEEYLNSMEESEPKSDSAVAKIKKIMSRYNSQLNIPENIDYKKMIRDWRYDDYLNGQSDKK